MKNVIYLLALIIATAVYAQQDKKSVSINTTDTLTLETCIRIALENQPVISASQGAILTSESEYTQVRSLYFPQIQVDAGAYMTNTPLQSANVLTPSPTIDPRRNKITFIPTMRMSVKQGIYDFGRTEKMLDSKEKLIKAAEKSLESTKDEVVLSVSLAYYNYALSIEVVRINEERVRQALKHLERAKGFYEVGKIAESEVSKAELELSNAELQLIDARGKKRLAKVNLNNAMGIIENDDDESDYRTSEHADYEPFRANLKESIDQALESRKDISASALKISAWKSALSSARSQYRPIITAFAGVSPYLIQKNPLANINQDQYKLGYNIGVNFEFPIFQGLSVRADIAEAQGGLRIATAQANVLRQKIIQDVQEKFFSVRYAEERYKATDKLIAQGERNLKLAEGRFDTGIGSAIEITDANVSLANAKIERMTALYEYKMALLRFQKSVGSIQAAHQTSLE